MADPWSDSKDKQRMTTRSGADAKRPQRRRVPSRIASNTKALMTGPD